MATILNADIELILLQHMGLLKPSRMYFVILKTSFPVLQKYSRQDATNISGVDSVLVLSRSNGERKLHVLSHQIGTSNTISV